MISSKTIFADEDIKLREYELSSECYLGLFHGTEN